MGLLDYISLLVRRGWILLLLVVLGASGAYFLTRNQTPIYRSTQVMLVQPARPDLGISQATQALLNAYVIYLYSNPVAEQIIKEQNLGDIAPEQLKSIARIGADPTRMTIQIEIDTIDGELANRIAYAWGQKLVAYRNQTNEGLPEAEHIDAVPQDNPRYSLYRPRIAINAILGGLVGFIFAAVIVFILEYRKNIVIHHREDLASFNLLAVVPEEI